METYDSENINSKMIFLFIGVSLFSFFFYILKHPLFHLISYGVNRSALVAIYLPDLFIYLAVLLPYEIMLTVFFVRQVRYRKKIADEIFIIFFFPLFGFFSKGMFLPHVYIELSVATVIKNNIFFIIFSFIGLFLNFILFITRKIHDRFF
ncbi:MAG: hypothetical protein J1G30_03730 [Spirochaetales bacterium]|nr:hypothetical protein [Spirochaetales bacterium]